MKIAFWLRPCTVRVTTARAGWPWSAAWKRIYWKSDPGLFSVTFIQCTHDCCLSSQLYCWLRCFRCHSCGYQYCLVTEFTMLGLDDIICWCLLLWLFYIFCINILLFYLTSIVFLVSLFCHCAWLKADIHALHFVLLALMPSCI